MIMLDMRFNAIILRLIPLFYLIFSLGVIAAENTTPPLNELEEKFMAQMDKATMKGFWRLIKETQLSPAKEETYNIRSARKVKDNTWLINSRMRFGKTDVTVPIPVTVVWAGDTPVISITELPIPGVGTYTARVLIYENTYAGTWSGPGYGGLLSGVIVKEETE